MHALCSFCQINPAMLKLTSKKTGRSCHFCHLHYNLNQASQNHNLLVSVIGETATIESQQTKLQTLFDSVFDDLRGELMRAYVEEDMKMGSSASASASTSAGSASTGTSRKSSITHTDVLGAFLSSTSTTKHKIAQPVLRTAVQKSSSAQSRAEQRSNPFSKISTRPEQTFYLGEKDSWTAPVHQGPKFSGYKCEACNGFRVTSTTLGSRGDFAKAETWGNKDREGEVLIKCLCESCGTQWQVEG